MNTVITCNELARFVATSLSVVLITVSSEVVVNSVVASSICSVVDNEDISIVPDI